MSERAYWSYEIAIKRLETALWSMVGGDGAIYAIRRPLWRPLPEDAINDFLNPLQIVAAGWRGVYEPEAICHEETAAGIGREWKRRVRIVSRSWRAVFQAGRVLNPFRVGLFAWCLLSHKVLRWFSGLFLGLAIAGVTVACRVARRVAPPAVLHRHRAGRSGLTMGWSRRAAAFASYFVVINAASFVGLVRGTFGSVSGVWATPRAEAGAGLGGSPRHPHPACWRSWRWRAPAVLLAATGARFAPAVFWAAMGTLAYVYAGYPLVVRLWAAIARSAGVGRAD